jgi:hypothetical protein
MPLFLIINHTGSAFRVNIHYIEDCLWTVCYFYSFYIILLGHNDK